MSRTEGGRSLVNLELSYKNKHCPSLNIIHLHSISILNIKNQETTLVKINSTQGRLTYNFKSIMMPKHMWKNEKKKNVNYQYRFFEILGNNKSKKSEDGKKPPL